MSEPDCRRLAKKREKGILKEYVCSFTIRFVLNNSNIVNLGLFHQPDGLALRQAGEAEKALLPTEEEVEASIGVAEGCKGTEEPNQDAANSGILNECLLGIVFVRLRRWRSRVEVIIDRGCREIGSDDCERALRSSMLFLPATSRGAHAAADTHDNETNDHERYHDDYGNGPTGEAIAFAVGSDGRSPAVVPSFVAAVSGALVIGRAVLVLVSCAISWLRWWSNPHRGSIAQRCNAFSGTQLRRQI